MTTISILIQQIFLFLFTFSLILIMIIRFFRLNRKYQSLIGVTPLIPVDQEFTQLLKQITELDYESKIRILQACLGHKIRIVTESNSKNVHVLAASSLDYDLNELLIKDRSIG